MLRFRLAGIPVAVQPFFWVLALVLGLSSEITGIGLGVWIVVVFVSVLIHELGHAFTVRRVGYSPAVVLHFIGGVTTWRPEEELAPRPRVLTTLAGPAAGFALAAGAWAVYQFSGLGDGDSLGRDTLVWLMFVNIVWGAFNLIPIRGLDGGQALRALLEIAFPALGKRIAEGVYIVVGIGAIVFGLVYGYFILAIFAAMLTFGSYFSRAPRRPRRPPTEVGPDAGEPRLNI